MIAGATFSLVLPIFPLLTFQQMLTSQSLLRGLLLRQSSMYRLLRCSFCSYRKNFSTRLTIPEVDYILEHSGAKLVLVDYEYTKFVKEKTITFVVCNDTGREGDPYEEYLGEFIILFASCLTYTCYATSRRTTTKS